MDSERGSKREQLDSKEEAHRKQTGSKGEARRSIRERMDDMELGKKSKRLAQLWPGIEAKLAQGATHPEIFRLLKEDGLDLTYATYKNYVHRLRKKERKTGVGKASRSNSTSPGTQTVTPSDLPRTTGRRPRTFNFDPRGNPDLLK